MIEIEVKYTEDNQNKTRKFNDYELFGLWIANNYDSILIHDVIQSEEIVEDSNDISNRRTSINI